MSAEFTPAVHRAANVLFSASATDAVCYGWVPQAREALAAALDDPDLAALIRDWRLATCDHSRLLNRRAADDGEPEKWEQACSPCVRDRLRAWLLGGAS